MMDSVKASGPTTPATPRVDLQGNNPQAYMVHKKYPEPILGPWGQTSLDIGIFSISFGMLVVGQDNFLFSCLGWVLQHPNCNPCAEATTRGPASVFTGTMWGAGLLHCHPNIQSTFMRGAGSAALLFCHRPNWVQYHGGEKADSALLFFAIVLTRLSRVVLHKLTSGNRDSSPIFRQALGGWQWFASQRHIWHA